MTLRINGHFVNLIIIETDEHNLYRQQNMMHKDVNEKFFALMALVHT